MTGNPSSPEQLILGKILPTRHFSLVALLCLVSFDLISQDNILQSTCNCLDKLLAVKLDKVEFQFAHDDCHKEVYTKLISMPTQDSADLYYSSFVESMKANCDSYGQSYEVLDKMTLNKSKSKVRHKSDCKKVMRVGEFEDTSGTEKAIMSMQDSIQIMTFGKPELYTKSKVVWVDECTYRTIFIESTNPFENGVLKKGDERVIRIIDISPTGKILFEVGMYGRWFLGKVTKIK
jgi:hypothetical protein